MPTDIPQQNKTKKHLTPTQKGWRLLRKTLDDPEKYHTLKNLKKPIEVTGSEGGRYFLYPNGKVVNLADDKPAIAAVVQSNGLVQPDVLITLFLAISQTEDEFLKNWGCGNLRVGYNRAREWDEGFYPANETVHAEPRRDSKIASLLAIGIIGAVLALPLIAIATAIPNLFLSLNSLVSNATSLSYGDILTPFQNVFPYLIAFTIGAGVLSTILGLLEK